jgi:hypothetical protein
MARSAGSSLGHGVWRRRTVSWWRRTRISRSLAGIAAGEQHEHLNGAAQREVGEFRQHQGDLAVGVAEAPRYRAAAGANWQLTAHVRVCVPNTPDQPDLLKPP